MPQLPRGEGPFCADDPEKYPFGQVTESLLLVPNPIDCIIVGLVQSFFSFLHIVQCSINLLLSEFVRKRVDIKLRKEEP